VAESAEPLPAYSLPAAELGRAPLASGWPFEVSRDWALGGSTGDGVRVCLIDSGVEAGHPLVGPVERAVTVVGGSFEEATAVDDDVGDVFGHGTACAGIIHSIAPASRLTSVRVLGTSNRGSGQLVAAGLRWAVEEGFAVINLSLSTTKAQVAAIFRDLTDSAYFRRSAVVASAHNRAIESYPWRFSSVISVASHDLADPLAFFYNPAPPVEFLARGAELEVAWLGGGTLRSDGNSFATAHISGICALILAKHPELTAFELKSVLYLIADNVAAAGNV
jgi:subtilisin family serine protease